MKILIVHPQMALYGGAEVVVVRLARYLQEQGHKVDILTLSTAKHTDYEGLSFILPKHETQYRLRGDSFSALRDVYHVYRELRSLCLEHGGYDVVNPHNFPAIWSVPKHGRVVWMCNEIPDLWHNRRIPRLINPLLNAGRFGDRLVARGKHPRAVVADDGMAQLFRHRYLLEPIVIPYGIDGSFFAQPQAISRDGFCVIQPSMVSPSKNQMAVLEAAGKLGTKVVFAGYREDTNPYTTELDTYAARNGVDAVFTGHVSREELRTLYYKASVAIFSGRGQGSWLGPFEALATGRPVIVSPNLTCAETIRREDIGLVTNDIVSAVEDVRTNYAKRQRQALRGREFVLRELTWDKFCSRFEELLV